MRVFLKTSLRKALFLTIILKIVFLVIFYHSVLKHQMVRPRFIDVYRKVILPGDYK